MFLNNVDKLKPHHKNRIAIMYDTIIAFISFPLALSLRYDSIIEPFEVINKIIPVFGIIFAIKLSMVYFYKAHKGVWRFASIRDLSLIIKAGTIASVLSVISIFFFTRLQGIPRTVFFIDWGLTILLMASARFSFRMYKERRTNTVGVKTILVGAGSFGEQFIRDINREHREKFNILGIIDESQKHLDRTIHGIPVIGTVEELGNAIYELSAEQIIIAIDSNRESIKKVLEVSNYYKVKTMIAPGIKDLIDGKVTLSELRPINIEDLLGREPVSLDQTSVSSMISGKSIMVTGGGGSIGSELCRQVLKFKPSKLIIFESCEYFIYNIHMKLTEEFPGTTIIPIVGDVREKSRVTDVMSKYRPSIIFHAAAYKHVPMMEANPKEAIKTNVMGTRNVAEASVEQGLEKFILISTDKAVNPTNVMGTTKRIAEQLCQHISKDSETKFAIVRFGNVLASNGSVVPRFWEQIKNGGPVTVTHPEITRYFMSIPEACQLVMQAGALSNGGEIFVLDMGNPVKIVDLAKEMIRLSGKDEDEIEITFTGLRPGEKLYEELLSDTEQTTSTPHNKIRVATATSPSEGFMIKINELVDSSDIRTAIKDLVPEYMPTDLQ